MYVHTDTDTHTREHYTAAHRPTMCIRQNALIPAAISAVARRGIVIIEDGNVVVVLQCSAILDLV